MDPDACLIRAWYALNVDDREDAREALREYSTWRRNGGFEPENGDKRAHDMRVRLGIQTAGKVST